MGAQIKDKDFDGTAWAVKHDSSFEDLIANARKSRRQAEQKTEEDSSRTTDGDAQKSENEPGTQSRGPVRGPSIVGTTSDVIDLSGPQVLLSENPEQRMRAVMSHPAPPEQEVYLGALNNLPNVGNRRQ